MTCAEGVLAVLPATRALRDLWATGLEKVQVVLGPVAEMFEDNVLMVAAPTDEAAAIIGNTAPSDQGHAQSYTFEVVCLLSCYSGDTALERVLARAESLFADLTELVAANPDLSETVAVADMGNRFQVALRNDQDGVAVEIAFTVACEVY